MKTEMFVKKESLKEQKLTDLLNIFVSLEKIQDFCDSLRAVPKIWSSEAKKKSNDHQYYSTGLTCQILFEIINLDSPERESSLQANVSTPLCSDIEQSIAIQQ